MKKVKIVLISNGPDVFVTTGDTYIQGEDKIYAIVEFPDGNRHRVNLYKYDDEKLAHKTVECLNKIYFGMEVEVPENKLPEEIVHIGHYMKNTPGNSKTIVKANYRKFNNWFRRFVTGNTKITKLK